MDSRSSFMNRWAIILVSAWAAFVLVFFLAHAPWDGVSLFFKSLGRGGPAPGGPEALRRAAPVLMSLGAGLWILWLNFRLGDVLSRPLALRISSPWLKASLHFVIGMGALQLFNLGTGFNRLWEPLLLSLFGLAATAVFIVMDVMDRASGKAAETPEKAPDETRDKPGWEKTLAVLGMAVALLGFLVALLPETFYDSMAYVLAVPRQWLVCRGIPNHPWHMYDHFFLGASLWYANGLAAGGVGAARIQSASLLPAIALLAGGWAAESWGKRAGYAVLGLTLVFPLLALNTWACRSDAFMALALVAGFYALERMTGKPGRTSIPWLFLSGAAFGFAFSAKIVAATAAPAAVLLLFLRRRDVGWKGTGVLFGGWILFAGPWFLRNLVDMGNPVYPYLPNLFGGLRLPDWGLARLLYENKLTAVSWGQWPPVPWRLMMPGYGASQNTGPLALALLPVLFLNRNFKTRLFWAVVVLFVFGLAAAPVLRFQLAGFVLVFLLLVRGLDGVSPAFRNLMGWGAVACVLSGFVLLTTILAARYDPVPFWTLRESQEAYLQRVVRNPTAELASAASQAVPDGGRLLLVGDGRALDFNCPIFWNSVDDEPFLSQAAKGEADASGILVRLKRSGITHVAFNLPEGRETATDYGHWRLTSEERVRLIRACRAYLQPLWASNGCLLFKVGTAPPVKGRKTARPKPWEKDAFWEGLFPPPAKQ